MTVADKTEMMSHNIIPNRIGLNPTSLILSLDKPVPIKKRV